MQEQLDGAAAIEWLATQPWCTGKIGMIGSSYGGFTAVQIAALALRGGSADSTVRVQRGLSESVAHTLCR